MRLSSDFKWKKTQNKRFSSSHEVFVLVRLLLSCLVFACFYFVNKFLRILCFLCCKKFSEKCEFVMRVSFTILLLCSPLNSTMESYFLLNLLPIFFHDFFYLHAPIFICENFFLFMLICENLFLSMIICETLFY